MGLFDDTWTGYGAGAGGGTSPSFGTPYALDTSYSTYQKPSLLSSALSSSSSSTDWKPSDYLTAAQLIYGAYQNNNAKKRASQPPKFAEVPQTAQEKKLWDLFYAQQTDPGTKDNRALVSGYARDMLANSHPTWDAPKTSTGETGYSGNSGMKWPAIPAFDWSGYTNGNGNGSPTPTTPTPHLAPPPLDGGGGSDPVTGGKGSPMNKSFVDDPFGGSGGGGGGNPTDDQSIYDWLTQNPGGNVGAHLPNQGQGTGPSASQINNARPEFYALEHPENVPKDAPPDIIAAAQNSPGAWQTAWNLVHKYGNTAATVAGMAGGPEVGLVMKITVWLADHYIPHTAPGAATTPPPAAPPPVAPPH